MYQALLGTSRKYLIYKHNDIGYQHIYNHKVQRIYGYGVTVTHVDRSHKAHSILYGRKLGLHMLI